MLRVNCGVQPCDEQTLPVFRVEPLPCAWTPPQNSHFSLLFTSQNAVHVFAETIFPQLSQNPFLWQNLICVAAVGAQTALSCEQHLPPHLLKQPVIYPQEQNGLLHALELPTLKSNQVFIFTNLLGKSSATTHALPQHASERMHTVPIYTLKEYDSQFFLDTTLKLKKRVAQNESIVFCCKSGLILQQTAAVLTEYFNCKHAFELPTCILFSVWEHSAEQTLQKLQLEDRKIPWTHTPQK